MTNIPSVPQGQSTRPGYLRLPKRSTRCHHTGLSRTMLESLVLPKASNNYRPPVKSLTLSEGGQGERRGARLIDCDDLMRYLKRIQGEQAAAASVATNDGTATRAKLSLKKAEKEGSVDVR